MTANPLMKIENILYNVAKMNEYIVFSSIKNFIIIVYLPKAALEIHNLENT